MTSNISQAAAEAPPAVSVPSLLDPLRQLPVFRFIWLALLAENVCSWLMDVTNGWLMTSLSTSPLWVSLVQTATTLPVLMLALPAGALADILRRRSILLFVQCGLAATNGVIAILTFLGGMTQELLLVLIFVNSIFLAIGMPAWQSLLPELVSGPLLRPALLLGGTAVNASRAIGPALAGVLIATGGPAAAFATNVFGYLFVWFALKQWPGPTPRLAPIQLPTEHVVAAVASGLRYALNDPNLRRVLIRFGFVALAASAFWATLPLTARAILAMSSLEYGLLMACFGAGAVLGAWLMNRHLGTANLNTIVAANSVLLGLCMSGFALIELKALAYPLIFLLGAGWLALTGCFAVSVQSTVSAWVRARALSLMVIALQGSLAVGGLAWGLTAQRFGIPAALVAGAALMLLGLVATFRLTIAKGDMSRMEAYGLLPPVTVVEPTDATRAPVQVQLEYRVSNESRAEFVTLMQSVGAMRRRNGALSWQLLEDMAQPGRWNETFEAPTFVDHERQRERLSVADRELLARAYALHQGGGTPPLLSRWLGPSSTTV